MKLEAFLLGLLLALTMRSSGQQVSSAVFNSMAPQHRDWRITSQPDHGYFSILSNGSFLASNTLLHPATWLVSVPGQSAVQVDLDAIFEGFTAPNAVEANASLALFNAGFFIGETRKTFVDLAANHHVQTRLGLPADLLRLPFTGNARFNGADAVTLDLGSLETSLLHYRSYSAGLQHSFGDRLRAGLRIHRLHGYHHLAIEENRWKLTTDAADWSWNLQGGGRVVSSGLNELYQVQSADQLDSLMEVFPEYVSSLDNKGWGADVGVEMQWNNRWSTWLQFNLGGTIRWTNDVLAYEVDAFDWELDGFDATNGGNGWVDGVDALTDSVERWAEQELAAIEAYHVASESNASYKAKLPNRFIAGAEYTLLQGEKGGRVSMGGLIEKVGKRPTSWSLAVNARVGNGLQSTLTFGNRFGLVSTWGVSVAKPLGPILLFAAAEGHQALDWSHFSIENEDELVEWSMPTNAPYVAAQAGVVWRLNWRKPKPEPEAEPMVPFQNSTRSPALGFDVLLDNDAPEPLPCALPGEN